MRGDALMEDEFIFHTYVKLNSEYKEGYKVCKELEDSTGMLIYKSKFIALDEFRDRLFSKENWKKICEKEKEN